MMNNGFHDRSIDWSPATPVRTIRLSAVKARTGQVVTGTMVYDGLSDLWSVTQEDGSTAYVSCLDKVTSWEEI